MNEATKQPMNRRALTSMFMFFSFMLLPISGIPLHFSRTESEPSVLEHYLMSVHNMSALIFLIAVVIHLSLNWGALTKYITGKTEEYFHFKKEMVIALITVLAIVGIFSLHALHAPPITR
jgi:hypothetical protein